MSDEEGGGGGSGDDDDGKNGSLAGLVGSGGLVGLHGSSGSSLVSSARARVLSSPPLSTLLASSISPALVFELSSREKRARRATMTTHHFACQLPMFMPVGTQGSVKGLTALDLENARVQLILGNTYHLEQRPGSALIETMGGLHNFVSWKQAMLTDSGGFQMVSLSDLLEVSEHAVTFQDPATGNTTTLTPEHCMQVQNRIGADIMMALDDVVSSTANDPKRYEEATYRTTRWLKRCIAAHKRTDRQSLFGIVQGGLDLALRRKSCEELVPLNLPGYAVGGLSGGEDKANFWRGVDASLELLPENKPRYVMGVGYPVDIVVCVALGADMFDCVYPTRTARFGTAMVSSGLLKLRSRSFANDMRPIEAGCDCATCKRYTRAYLHTIVTREPVASSLVSVHNVRYMMRLMEQIREAIENNRFEAFVQQFMRKQFPRVRANDDYAVPYEKMEEDGRAPVWVREALAKAGIALKS